MKAGSRVIVTFAESDILEPSPGKVAEQQYREYMGLLIKIQHDTGLDN